MINLQCKAIFGRESLSQRKFGRNFSSHNDSRRIINRCNYLLAVGNYCVTRGQSVQRSSMTSVQGDHSQPALSTLTTSQIFGQRIP